MTTLQTIAVSSKLFRRLESLAQARGLNVMRLVEPVLQAGIETVKDGRELVIDFGKPAGVSSEASDPSSCKPEPD